MRLDGIHHITAITADAQQNLDFYVGTLGLRFVKRTVNFDAPQSYHLYYGDDLGSPGTIMTFFEFKGVDRGSAGAGMIDTVAWRAPEASLDRWRDRLSSAGIAVEDRDGVLSFEDPEGLNLQIVGTPGAHAESSLLGFDSVRALVADPRPTEELMKELSFDRPGEPYAFEIDGRALYRLRISSQIGVQGAGTVHHIAWACELDQQESWRERVQAVDMRVTPIIDRTYFRSIYFREPSGVLFEIATKGPGFTVDESPDELGKSLQLPPQHEPLRQMLERDLTPLNPPSSS